MRGSRGHRRTRGAAAALAGALVLLAGPVPRGAWVGSVARAEATCTYDAGRRALGVEDTDDVELARDADGLILVDGAPLAGDCAGLTIEDVDAIALAAQGRVTLDLRDGGFRHGDGAPVPVALELPGATDALAVRGTDAAEAIAAGTAGVDLSGDGAPDVTGLEGAEALDLQTAGGNDDVTLRGGGDLGAAWDRPATVDAGEGDDGVLGGDGPDRIIGGPGEDELDGRRGDDRFDAAPAPDGPDLLQGGTGTDTADYGERAEDLQLLLRMFDASGAAGEADSLVGIEVAIGGVGDDRLIGVGMNETLVGGPGRDEIRGGGGRDLLRGGPGADVLDGEREADELRGGGGDDRLLGGDRADTLSGGSGDDVLKGGDGRDTGSGGLGRDRCLSIERARGCETVLLRSPLRAASPASRAGAGTLDWSTFLGGKVDDHAAAVARPPSGGLVVVGTSAGSWGTPLRPFGGGGGDAFVARLDATGHLLWSTFLGGTGPDVGADVAVAADGTILVGGWSGETWGAPLRPFGGGAADGFVAALGPDGALRWHTFLGGGGRDRIAAVDVVQDGSILAVGTSAKGWGAPVEGFHGGTDLLVVGLDAAGTLRWVTFVGGASEDQGFAIAARPGGGAFVAGASSEGFGAPVRAFSGGGDGLLAAVEDGGALGWVTFLGGAGEDLALAVVAVEADGGAIVAGRSDAAWGTPALPYAGRTDGFVARLDAAGAVTWSTFLGGTGWDEVAGLRPSPDGGVFAVGTSSGSWGEPRRPFAGGRDAFLAALGGAGRLTWLGFLGGAGRDEGADAALGDLPVFVVGTSDAAWGEPVRAFRGGWSDAFAAAVPSRRVDLAIGPSRPGPFVGVGTTGPGQTLSLSGERGEVAGASIRVANAGMLRDAVQLLGCAPAPGFGVRYLQGETDVTSQVLAGTYRTEDLAPGRGTTLRLEVRVKRTAEVGDVFRCSTLGSSAAAPRVRDAVRLLVEVA